MALGNIATGDAFFNRSNDLWLKNTGNANDALSDLATLAAQGDNLSFSDSRRCAETAKNWA
ncbi:MAG: hypothetical protein HRT35_11700 [Algicola sp.]|nr:hypothetical protein [Algicola sp.]